MATKTYIPAETRLFKPLKVGNMTLQHRIVMPPLTRLRNGEDHAPLSMMLQHYADRAVEPGTLLIAEATSVSPEEEGEAHVPGFSTEGQVAGWAKIYDAVHAKGSFIFQQLWGMGRSSDPDYLAKRNFSYHSSSTVPLPGHPVSPRAMTEDEIQAFIQQFAEAAKRVVAAGGDGVEVHGAHGYLLDQFLSDQVNTRTDRWGGSIENRSRLILEVVRAVVAAIGAERVGLRLSPFAGFQAAQKTDIVGTYRYILGELKAMKVPLAYLSLVEPLGDPAILLYGHDAINTEKTLDFMLEEWGHTSPVLISGGYKPASAAQAVEDHYSQWDVMIGIGRLFIANPDFVFRARNGLSLNAYDRTTFYLKTSVVGYNDYPFSEEYLKSIGKA